MTFDIPDSLRPDTIRLDWLQEHPNRIARDPGMGKWCDLRHSGGGYPPEFLTIREAIDAAIAAEESAKEPK